MARQIPEIIGPSNLIIPSTNDQFGVIAGGLPNGDSCLRINGSGSSNHTAVQSGADSNLGSANSNIFGACWIRRVSGGQTLAAAAGGPPAENLLFSFCADFGSTPYTGRSLHVFSDAIVWQMGNVGGRVYTLTDTDWHFVVFQHRYTPTDGAQWSIGRMDLWVDLVQVTATGSGLDGGGVVDNEFVGIGNPQPDEAPDTRRGVDGIVDIGHLAFFSSALSSTQRSGLYDAMYA